MMADPGDDELAERLLDVFVYAPLGLALEAKEMIPKLAERGRGQVALTRLAGTVAAQRGQAEASKLIDEISDALATFFGGDSAPATPAEPKNTGGGDLPILGYAELTAVEIVRLIAELDDEELDIIEAFERAHRNRSTVLNRIRQRRD
jgi:hypothetical protein